MEVSLSMYDLLLTLDIKGLSSKEIRIHLFDQNCKSHLTLIFYFFRIPPWLDHAFL